MKQGWIQIENGETREALAPKTMADMVYVDEAQTKTVKEALAEGFVAVFEHTMSEVNGQRVHNFEGPSGFEGMGRALITETVLPNDQITVNGIVQDAFLSGAYLAGGSLFTLFQGSWSTFVVDGASINFNLGGTDKNYQVISVPSTDMLPAATIENTFAFVSNLSAKKVFVQGNTPTALDVGDVWIETSTGTQISVNMSKRDEILIYPLRIAQWSGSTWDGKEMRLYQEGTWKVLGTMVYDAGNMFLPYAYNGHYDYYNAGGWKTPNPHIFFEADKIKVSGLNSWHLGTIEWYLDVTHYRRVRIDVEVIKGKLNLSLADNIKSTSSIATAVAQTPGRYDVWLDITGFTGLKSLKLWEKFNNDTEAYVHQIFLEYKAD